MLNVRHHGAKGDARFVTGGAMSAGSDLLTLESAPFVPSDTGKSVSVAGAGVNGGTLVGTITAYSTAQAVQLTPAASTTVSRAAVNWGTDDTAAIQATIDAAKALPRATVYFPPGRYRLTHAIRPEADNMTLFGSSAAILVADPADDEPCPEAILVHKNFPLGPDAVRHLTLRGFSVDMNNGVRTKTWGAAAIQLNNCPDCLVTDMRLTYSGSSSKPMNLDGIAVTTGTTGRIAACNVDAFPKVNGPTPDTPALPATNIQVTCGMYNDNGLIGIEVGSGFDGVQPQNIQLVGVATLNNDGDGIRIDAGRDIQITSPTVVDSGRLVDVDVPGIGLRAADHVTVDGGVVSKTPARRQVYGVGLYRSPVGDASTKVRILDVDAAEGQSRPVEALDLNGVPDASPAAQTGCYRD